MFVVKYFHRVKIGNVFKFANLQYAISFQKMSQFASSTISRPPQKSFFRSGYDVTDVSKYEYSRFLQSCHALPSCVCVCAPSLLLLGEERDKEKRTIDFYELTSHTQERRWVEGGCRSTKTSFSITNFLQSRGARRWRGVAMTGVGGGSGFVHSPCPENGQAAADTAGEEEPSSQAFKCCFAHITIEGQVISNPP